MSPKPQGRRRQSIADWVQADHDEGREREKLEKEKQRLEEDEANARILTEDERDFVPTGPHPSPRSEMTDPFDHNEDVDLAGLLEKALKEELRLQESRELQKAALEGGSQLSFVYSTNPDSDLQAFNKRLQEAAKRSKEAERERREVAQYELFERLAQERLRLRHCGGRSESCSSE